jgi:tetratricopeptide (TPR) repeat protein/predicted Ser/Thr protein kinase
MLLHVDDCEACRSLVGALGGSGTRSHDPRDEDEEEIARGVAFGRYLILEPIGRGGMGVVYAAYDPVLDRRVAIKVLRARGDEARARLLREGKAMARLSNAHVITVHDVGTAEGRDFVAMELVDGVTFGEWLRACERPWREVVGALVDAGRGLAAAHAEGLVHRDFKPDNVLVSRAGRVLVTDFGLARVERAAPAAVAPDGDVRPGGAGDEESGSRPAKGAGSTAAGVLAGTPAYMAPEQILGVAADARSDQFAFCVTAWEGLGGARPFDAITLSATLERIQRGDIGAPRRAIPPAVRRILARGLSASPERRYPSMTALLADLERHLGRRQRLRFLAVAVVVAAGLGAFGAVRSAAPRANAACRGAPAKWTGIWDAQARDAVRTSFAASGVPYATDAFRGVDAALSAYDDAWERMYAETCEATRVRGDQSEEVLQLRMECLDDRLGAARALTQLLRTAPDGETVQHAATAAQGLPSIAACADVKALRERVPPPHDPALAERVASLRGRLADVDALGSAGRFAEAADRAGPLAEEARDTGYAPVAAYGWRVLADSEYDAARYESSAAHWKQSILAAEAGGDLDAAANAWIGLVSVDGGRLEHFAEAHDAADHAWALLSRMQGADRLEASLHSREGIMLFREGKYAEARAEHERALAIERRIAPDSADLGFTLNGLGRTLLALEDLDGCVAAHEEALALFQRTLGPDHPNVATALGAIANAYLRKGRYDDAIARYSAGLAIQERVLGPDHPDTIATRDDIAAAEIAKGRFADGIAQLRESIAVLERKYGEDSPRLLLELDDLGVALEGQGKLDEAEPVLLRALAIAEKAYGPDHPHVELALVNLGDVLRSRKKLVEAADAYNRAVEICEKTRGPDSPHTAESLGGLGFVLLDERRPGAALPYFERADAIAEKSQTDPLSLAKIRFGLASALWDAAPAGAAARGRAQALAAQSLEGLQASGDRQSADVAEVRAWLAAHQAGNR